MEKTEKRVQDETFKDWLFRYQHIYRLRRTKKTKATVSFSVSNGYR